MDERAIKKLAITLIIAIAIIMLFKFMLTRTYSNLNKVQASSQSFPMKQQTVTSIPAESPAVSAVQVERAIQSAPDAAEPASAYPAASGVSAAPD